MRSFQARTVRRVGILGLASGLLIPAVFASPASAIVDLALFAWLIEAVGDVPVPVAGWRWLW